MVLPAAVQRGPPGAAPAAPRDQSRHDELGLLSGAHIMY